MQTGYDAQLGATLIRDDADRIRAVTHVDEYPILDAASAVGAALAYLRERTGGFALETDQLEGAAQRLSFLNPQPAGEEFRLREEKTIFDTTTVAFNQTFLNLPVWESGVTVTLKRAPWRALAATDTTERGIDAEMPSQAAIERFRSLFWTGEKSDVARRHRPPAGQDDLPDRRGEEGSRLLATLLGGDAASGHEDGPAPAGASLIRGRFYVYRHRAEDRLERPHKQDVEAGGEHQPLCGTPPPYPLPLPPVPDGISEGGWYVVAELVFRLVTGRRPMNWRALVEVETGAILYLRPLTSAVNGLVFTYDPITSTGVATNTPDQSSAVFDPLRDSVALPNLDAPVALVQALTGSLAALTDITSPTVAAPTESVGTDFDYGSRTSDFAAVNAYYHTDRFFQLVESLGFPLATYFDGTAFPVEVDHRGLGEVINAWCIGDGDGIDYTEYALADDTDTANPIGIATDWRVVLHELGGHGILYDHVGSPNFGSNRVHSLGDSFAMVLNDFGSEWHNGAAIDRFVLAPFVPAVPRRSDRDVASGWGWGGVNDNWGYDSEEILSTCMFRFYRSIGGDSGSLSRREFCARATAYLMLRAVSTLTPVSNPSTPEGILAALLAADAGDWTSEGLAGGAYNKVLTWAFEEQDLGGGAPPAVDVYIDDGRGGEYPYQPVHWANGSVWNRRAADGLFGHEEPELGSTNYAYCYVKNRGTSAAANVVVNGYHCKPSAGVTWPIDFDAMTTASVAVGTVNGSDSETVLVGPFEWTPTTNAFGHDCMLMIASATGDPSNVDLLSLGETYADWRLVPNDNNVGQRNVHPVAAGGGLAGLVASLQGKGFWIGNPGRRPALLDVSIALPSVLARAGWEIAVRGLPRPGERAKPGERRLVTFEVRPGRDLDPQEIRRAKDLDIVVTALADGAPVGGMSYRLDPDLKAPHNDGAGKPGPADGEPGSGQGKGSPPLLWWILLLLLLILLLLLLLLLRS